MTAAKRNNDLPRSTHDALKELEKVNSSLRAQLRNHDAIYAKLEQAVTVQDTKGLQALEDDNKGLQGLIQSYESEFDRLEGRQAEHDRLYGASVAEIAELKENLTAFKNTLAAREENPAQAVRSSDMSSNQTDVPDEVIAQLIDGLREKVKFLLQEIVHVSKEELEIRSCAIGVPLNFSSFKRTMTREEFGPRMKAKVARILDETTLEERIFGGSEEQSKLLAKMEEMIELNPEINVSDIIEWRRQAIDLLTLTRAQLQPTYIKEANTKIWNLILPFLKVDRRNVKTRLRATELCEAAYELTLTLRRG